MLPWKGLDSGGTEQLWKTNVILSILETFSKHSPVDKQDPGSPIYADLKMMHPKTTWQNYDAKGSFRPIFRKSHPTNTLEQTEKTSAGEQLTSVGYDLLHGFIDIEEVFITATRKHSEKDGVKSFSLIATALIDNPLHCFTLEDIEFGVSRHFDPQKGNLNHGLLQVKNQPSALLSNRKRRINHMMTSLVTAGVAKSDSNGWKLDNMASAIQVAHAALISPNKGPVSSIGLSGTVINKSVIHAIHSGKTVRAITATKARKRLFKPFSNTFSDPEQRLLLLEKAHSIHEDLVHSVAQNIEKNGGTPTEDLNSYDVGVSDLCHAIFEIKSINNKNIFSQMRKAVAQLSEYRWRHRASFPDSTFLAIVTNENPKDFIDEDYVDYLTQDRHLTLVWVKEGSLICHDGRTLSETLVHLSKINGSGLKV